MTKPTVTETIRAENARLAAENKVLKAAAVENERKLAASEAALGKSRRDAESDHKFYLTDTAELRSELHASEMRCAELQGYVKALSDSEPPLMVPSRAQQHIESLVREPRRDDEYRAFGRDPKPRWFNRGRV